MKRMAAAIDQEPRAGGYPASARVPTSADDHEPIDQITDPPGLGQDGEEPALAPPRVIFGQEPSGQVGICRLGEQ